ncbi:hypothetical protein ACU8KH_04803 [Lachancea thermotolerans]
MEAPMNLDEVVNSFKNRVDQLSRDWDAIKSSFVGSQDEELKQLKVKFDLIQEQNSVILIDLYQLKKFLNLEDNNYNNVFSTVLDSPAGALHFPTASSERYAENAVPATSGVTYLGSVEQPRIHETQSALRTQQLYSSASSKIQEKHPVHLHSLWSEIHSPLINDEISYWKKTRSPMSPQLFSHLRQQNPKPTINDENDATEYLGLSKLIGVETPSKNPREKTHGKLQMKPLNSSLLKSGQTPCSARHLRYAKDAKDISAYVLKMSGNPKTVGDMYYEYEHQLRPQILEFEKRYGKGQISRLPKVRTYQRRRALINEIEKFARREGKSIEEAVQYFEEIRTQNKKTVPWLYNNLNRILQKYC